jgi:hypothetical protein
LLQFILFCCSVAVASEVEATVVEAAIVESAVVKIAEAAVIEAAVEETAVVEATIKETAVVETTVEETAIVETTVVVAAREIVCDNHTVGRCIRHRLGRRRFRGSQCCEASQKSECGNDEKPPALAL